MQQDQPRYRDYADASTILAQSLVKHAGQNVVVLGVGLGGVVVAAPVADALGADLDVLVVRPLTEPGHADRPWGAVAALGDCVQVAADPDNGGSGDVPAGLLQRDVIDLRRLENLLRDGRPPEPVKGRVAILVTDGLAGVAVLRAAASAVRRHRPARLVVALPAATGQTCRDLRRDADDVVCPRSLGPFRAIAPVYAAHPAASSDDVRRLLSPSLVPAAHPSSGQLPGLVG